MPTAPVSSDRDLARWRLRTQRLSASPAVSAAEVVAHLLCVQAENPGQSAWAVATRSQHRAPDDLAGLLASGQVLRTHVLRTTWHYARREDLDWLLALTGPRLQQLTERGLLGEAGLTPADVERLGGLVVDVLGEQPDSTRTEVAEQLRERAPGVGEQLTGQAVMWLMAHLEMGRHICSGTPRDGAEHTYARWADRVGDRVDLDAFDREEALGRIALRYLTGHGPATAKDLSYWATLTATQARRGVEAVRDRLASFEHGGRTFWHVAGDEAPREPAEPAGHLLQMLDEMYRGYQDSRWVLDEAGLVPRGRETSMGIALLDGQLVAGMRRTLRSDVVRFDLTPHRPLEAHEVGHLEEAAGRYAAFLGTSPQVRIAPR